MKEDQVKRREFQENIAKVAGGVVVGRATGAFLRPDGVNSPYRDPEFVLGLARRASAMREEFGGIPVAGKVWAQARSIDAVLPQGGRAIGVAASEFSRQAAWVFCDARRPALAERFAGRALGLAKRAGDTEKQAAAHAALSSLLIEERKRFDLARFHAEEGLKLPELSDGYRAPLKGYLAWATGHGADSKVSRSRALQLIEQARGVDGLSASDSAWVQSLSGLVLHDLGENEEALAAFAHSLRLADPEQEAHAIANATRVALAARDLDRAAYLMGALSYSVPVLSSTRVDQKATSVLEESARWADVRDIRQAREMLMAAMARNVKKH